MASRSNLPLPTTLKLPEAVEFMEAYFDCSPAHARDVLERAIRDGSLNAIRMIHPDGGRIETKEISDWRSINWENGIVEVEGFWSGSPPTTIPVKLLLDRTEFLKAFDIETTTSAGPMKQGGRPAKYDWDAFWIEACRRVHEEGFPNTQSEFVTNMLDWFANQNIETIDSRTVEKKISKLYSVLRPA